MVMYHDGMDSSYQQFTMVMYHDVSICRYVAGEIHWETSLHQTTQTRCGLLTIKTCNHCEGLQNTGKHLILWWFIWPLYRGRLGDFPMEKLGLKSYASGSYGNSPWSIFWNGFSQNNCSDIFFHIFFRIELTLWEFNITIQNAHVQQVKHVSMGHSYP